MAIVIMVKFDDASPKSIKEFIHQRALEMFAKERILQNDIKFIKDNYNLIYGLQLNKLVRNKTKIKVNYSQLIMCNESRDISIINNLHEYYYLVNKVSKKLGGLFYQGTGHN